MKKLLRFCATHMSQTRIDEFEPRIHEESRVNLPIQLNNSSYPTTKYRIVAELNQETDGTLIKVRIKNDIYWSLMSIAILVMTLVILINGQSRIEIIISLFAVIAFIVSWVRTSNDLDRIEAQIRELFR